MKLFSNLFGKGKKEKEQVDNKTVFYVEQDEDMKIASATAQKTFKFFWRELYWEYRRIVRAHDFAMVKIPFVQKIRGQDKPLVEHMWINNIYFDGETITGQLVNAPNQLTNIAKGDSVSKTIQEIGDWMISIQGKTYGGFTIQTMRSRMTLSALKEHDTAWGLDFGDAKEVLLVYKQKENPDNLVDHPMDKNMGEQVREYLLANPSELTQVNKDGLSLLHREALAGNKSNISIILELGADKNQQSKTGKTALDYAKMMHWEQLVEVLK